MPCKDRLEELRQLARRADWRDHEAAHGDHGAHEDYGTHGDHAADTDELLAEVERLRRWIHDVEHNTQLVRRLHADPTFHTNRHLQEQLDALVTQSEATGLKVCGALRQLEQRARTGAATGAGGRIARLQYAATRRLYGDALQRHEHALQQLRDRQLRLLREQIRLTNLTVSDEECERLLESNNIALFVDNLQAETAGARLALREAEARRDELCRVERALAAVRDLFLQLAHLVASQQEQIDTVEYYALQAGERVESGGRQLLEGSVGRNKARQKKLRLAACLAAGLLALLLLLALLGLA